LHDSQIVKIISGLGKNEIYVLGTFSLTVYEFNNPNSLKKKDVLLQNIVSSNSSFVDIATTNTSVFVLDKS
jgi:hypothetical protein